MKTISILTVTNRPQFIDWATWNVSKQTYPNKEWIIINSSNQMIYPKFDNVKIFNEKGNVAQLRNIAMSKAGEYFVWMDDDDWQHPNKISLLADEIGENDIVGCGHGWFVDIETFKIRKYGYGFPIYINSLFRKEFSSLHNFPINTKAPDSRWMSKLLAIAKYRMLNKDHLTVPSFWLRHNNNVTGKMRIAESGNIKSLKEMVGTAWLDTDERLERLKDLIN